MRCHSDDPALAGAPSKPVLLAGVVLAGEEESAPLPLPWATMWAQPGSIFCIRHRSPALIFPPLGTQVGTVRIHLGDELQLLLTVKEVGKALYLCCRTRGANLLVMPTYRRRDLLDIECSGADRAAAITVLDCWVGDSSRNSGASE